MPARVATASRAGTKREVQRQAPKREAGLRAAEELLRPGDAEQQRSDDRHGDAEHRDDGRDHLRGGDEAAQDQARDGADGRRVVRERGAALLGDRRSHAKKPDRERDPWLGEHVVGHEEHGGLRAERRGGDRQGPERRVAVHPEGHQRAVTGLAEQPGARGDRCQLGDQKNQDRADAAHADVEAPAREHGQHADPAGELGPHEEGDVLLQPAAAPEAEKERSKQR